LIEINEALLAGAWRKYLFARRNKWRSALDICCFPHRQSGGNDKRGARLSSVNLWRGWSRWRESNPRR